MMTFAASGLRPPLLDCTRPLKPYRQRTVLARAHNVSAGATIPSLKRPDLPVAPRSKSPAADISFTR